MRPKASHRQRCCKMLLICVMQLAAACGTARAASSWGDPSYRIILKNDAIEARFQAGLLYELRDVRNGKALIALDPKDLPHKLFVFGAAEIDLDSCKIAQEAKA